MNLNIDGFIVKNVLWYSHGFETIGIVAGEIEGSGGQTKAYIGYGHGISVKSDIRLIVKHGARFHQNDAIYLSEFLKKEMNLNIDGFVVKNVLWYSHGFETIGIVAGEIEGSGGQTKAYIGHGHGISVKSDIRLIVKHGARFHKEDAIYLSEFLKKEMP